MDERTTGKDGGRTVCMSRVLRLFAQLARRARAARQKRDASTMRTLDRCCVTLHATRGEPVTCHLPATVYSNEKTAIHQT